MSNNKNRVIDNDHMDIDMDIDPRKYQNASFPINDDSIVKFGRWVKKPRDCVINAMELIGLLSPMAADIMRILVGDKGITTQQLEDIFKYTNPRYDWNFYGFTNIQSLSSITINDLAPGYALFCGYSGNDDHVFLIAKSLSGDLIYIDPQMGALCPLKSRICLNFIDSKKTYYILKTRLKQ
jgi:hypothetical protein